MPDPELQAERAHHDRVRAAMTSMRRTSADLLDAYHRDFAESRRNRRPGDARPDHNMGFAMAQHSAARLDDLAARDVPLFFGRLWLESGEDYHLGRRHVRDEADRSHPLVVDWRAPLAERFYRASAHQRQEVTRRRRFGFDGSTLTSLEDEDLRRGEAFASDLLHAEIERPRTGPMRDIVATIQPEQDELIRRDRETSLCVQGAPGTGKTAVGLHRAAWLLYTYQGRLEQSGMLVVGPNDGFLRYISGVLPTLGETSVWQMAVDDLTGAADAQGVESGDTAVVKHDARMAEVCRRAVWYHVGQADHDLVLTHMGVSYRLEATALRDIVARIHGTCRTWDSGRKSLEQAVVQALTREAEDRAGRPKDRSWVDGLKRHKDLKQVLDSLWPRLTSKRVLKRLFTDEEFRFSVCRDVLSLPEMTLLAGRKGTASTEADVLLLDEIQSQLRLLVTDKTYGHIVIDEAQDLSPMQCRAIARRCPTGALTVLGDLAQGTTPWAARTWDAQMRHLGRPDAEHTELTTGFRVPAVVIELASRLLPHLGVSVSPARSVRVDGTVEVVRADDLSAATRDAVDKALVEDGSVGVIAPPARLDDVGGHLPVSDRVELVPVHLAKGLEFDHVVVVEPADFLDHPGTAASPAVDVGLRHLYVAVTRAVSRLTIVHRHPLPAELGGTPPS